MGDKPDFLIKHKASDGKSKTIGAGWKKSGQWGPFVSIAIGGRDGIPKESYIMVPNEESQHAKGGGAQGYGARSNPPQPQKLTSDQWASLHGGGNAQPEPRKLSDILDDDLGI